MPRPPQPAVGVVGALAKRGEILQQSEPRGRQLSVPAAAGKQTSPSSLTLSESVTPPC